MKDIPSSIVMSLSLAEDREKKHSRSKGIDLQMPQRKNYRFAQKKLSEKTRRREPTVVPDLRMAVKVGADSMSNKIGTHLEATGLCYFTDGSHFNYNCENITLHYIIPSITNDEHILTVCTLLCSLSRTASRLACTQRWHHPDNVWQFPPSAAQFHPPRQSRRFLMCHRGNHPDTPIVEKSHVRNGSGASTHSFCSYCYCICENIR